VSPRGLDTSAVILAWGPVRQQAHDIRRLAIDSGPGHPLVGVPYQLRVSASDADGRAVAPALLTWRLPDTTAATVDSLGVLRARRPGRVWVEASAGGWRVARRELEITAPDVRTAIAEDWSSGIDTLRWRAFGDPLPTTVSDARLGRAMWNRGDGNDVSGVHSADRFPTARGLGLDVTLSSTFHRSQWRTNTVGFVDFDEPTMRAWDHRTGALYTPSGRSRCHVTYPASEGAGANVLAAFEGSGAEGRHTVPAAWQHGTPVRVRVQLFPDGRCGVALNGRAVWMSPPSYTAGSAYLELFGMSYDARVLVGPLTVFTGVMADIDWSLPSTRAR
jgi:hypothetical protein